MNTRLAATRRLFTNPSTSATPPGKITVTFDEAAYPDGTGVALNANWVSNQISGAGIMQMDTHSGDVPPHWGGPDLGTDIFSSGTSTPENNVIDMSAVGHSIATYQTPAGSETYTVRAVVFPDTMNSYPETNCSGVLIRGQAQTGPQSGYLVCSARDGGANESRITIRRIVNDVIVETPYSQVYTSPNLDKPLVLEVGVTAGSAVINWNLYRHQSVAAPGLETSGNHDTTGDAGQFASGLWAGGELERARSDLFSQPFIAGWEMEW